MHLRTSFRKTAIDSHIKLFNRNWLHLPYWVVSVIVLSWYSCNNNDIKTNSTSTDSNKDKLALFGSLRTNKNCSHLTHLEAWHFAESESKMDTAIILFTYRILTEQYPDSFLNSGKMYAHLFMHPASIGKDMLLVFSSDTTVVEKSQKIQSLKYRFDEFVTNFKITDVNDTNQIAIKEYQRNLKRTSLLYSLYHELRLPAPCSYEEWIQRMVENPSFSKKEYDLLKSMDYRVEFPEYENFMEPFEPYKYP